MKKRPIKYYFFRGVALMFIVNCATLQAADSLDFSVTVLSPENRPEAVVEVVLDSICPDVLLSENNSSDLNQVCGYIALATPEQIADVTEELSAKANTSTSTLTTRTPSTRFSGGIGGRLSALRNSSKKSSTNSFRAKRNRQSVDVPIFNMQQDEVGGLFSQQLSGFVNVNAVSAEQLETSTEIGYRSSSSGLLFGVDYRLKKSSFIGLASQYYQTDASLTDRNSELNSAMLGVTVYGTHFINDQWYVESTVSHNNQDLDLKRQIDLVLGAESVSVIANGETNSEQLGVYLGTGFDQPLPYGVNASASFGLSYASTEISGYTEKGAENLGLEIDSQSITSMSSYTMLYVSKAFSKNFGVLFPQLSASWIHEMETEEELIIANFVDDDNKFTFRTPQPDPNYFIIGADLQLLLAHGRMAYVKYSNVRLLRDKIEHVASAGFRLEF